MSVAYEGYIKLADQLILATACSAPRQRNKIESSSGYDGFIAGNGGMGLGHTYDHLSYDGNFSADLAPSLIILLKDWIVNHRNFPKQITVQSRKSGVGNAGMQNLPETFWTSISFESTQGSALSTSVSYISWLKYIDNIGTTDYNEVGDEYIINRTGFITDLSLESSFLSGGSIPALNPNDFNNCPVPFWNSNVSGLSGMTGSANVGTVINPYTWSVDFNQVAEKIFCCQAASSPQPPYFVAIGPLTGKLSFEIAVVDGSYTIQDNLSGIGLTMGSSTFSLGDLQLTNFTDDLQTSNAPTNIKLEYDIYGPLS